MDGVIRMQYDIGRRAIIPRRAEKQPIGATDTVVGGGTFWLTATNPGAATVKMP